MALDAKLRARASRLQKEDEAFKLAYPAEVEKAKKADATLRRTFSLPPGRLRFDAPGLHSWGAPVMEAQSSEYGKRSGELPKVDKTFFFRKVDKGNRTVPLIAADTAQWTASSWDVGGCTPSYMGCYSPAAPLDAPPRKTGTSGLPGYFESDYTAMSASAWSGAAMRQRANTFARPRTYTEVYAANTVAPVRPDEMMRTFTEGMRTQLGRSVKTGSHGVYKRPTKADRRDLIWFDKWHPEELDKSQLYYGG